jgi:hypothetical protein
MLYDSKDAQCSKVLFTFIELVSVKKICAAPHFEKKKKKIFQLQTIAQVCLFIVETCCMAQKM